MDPENQKLCNNMLDSSKASNLDNNSLIKSDCLKRTLDELVCHEHDPKSLQKHHNEEKNDISPENSNKKSNDTSPLSEFDKLTMTDSGFGSSKMNKSFSLQTMKNNPEPPPPSAPTDEDNNLELNRGMAFTIDFNSGKQIDEQRHKSMLERFQKNRHRRGVSMSSQAEDEMCDSSSSSQLTSKLKAPPSARLSRKKSIGPSMSGESSLEIVNKPATVRLRDKSKTNQLKDSSKRHSWSPRSSMASPTLMPPPPQPQQQAAMKSTRTSNRLMANALENPLKMHKLTAADMKSNMGPMFATSQPPLENKGSHLNEDSVSEAGTYTLDGDNYTEEQKEKMNIDKLTYEAAAAAAAKNDELLMLRRLEINENDSNIETDLEIIDLELIPSNNNMQRHTRLNRNEVSSMEVRNSRNNILEVSLCYEPPSNAAKQKVSYLEKLKTRMKNIGEKKFHKSKSPDPDVGCFTSVTTSGVLSIKPTLELHPRLKRKNSLTKSQIDSSEYVQGCHRMAATEKNSITDNDKTQMQIAAGYQLNIFSQQQPQPSPKGRKESCASSNTSISTAATKDDWIQEWAKNAREFSRQKRQPTAPTSTTMSQSYNFENVRDKNNQFGDFGDDANVMSRSDSRPQFDEFGDNLEKYYQQKQQQQKNHDNCNEQSLTLQQHPRQTNNLSQHESISSYRGRRILRDFDFNKDESRMNIKPPISPSRIPSPIGSMSNRTRRFSQSRGMYGSETDLTNDTELYLQRTAAAITTLQNLHRRNSLRNSSLQNSPNSPLSPTRPPPPPIVQSSKVTTTTGNRGNVVNPKTSVHKRNSSLDGGRFASTVMSSSLQSHAFQQQMNDSRNKQQQQQQQHHQQHSRHNSYDGMPPKSGTTKYSHHHHQFDQTTTDDDDYESFMLPEHNQLSIKQHKQQQQQHQQQQQQQQSPIKRSSSFNTKAAQDVPSPRRPSGTPKMQPKYTAKPVSAPTSAAHNRIQKSASAASFRKMLNDDDEFYINDDDDLNANQFSGSDFSDDDKKYEEPTISNTRFNKTFLMRREQAKNKAAGKQPMACPNTPEMPRRDTNVRASFRDRASMPRDSSLNRLQKDMKPLSANSSITSPNAQKNRGVTPKYLDISKYKPERGNNFLKRDESKSYLQKNEVKKSSSSICIQNAVNFQRVDVGRASSRSSGGAGGGSSSRPTSAGNKKKEVKTAAELAAWKRRTSYDPLKAAIEGKKKAEEAKRLAQQQLMMSSEGSSVLRSQSYHGEQDNMSSSRWIDESSSDLDDEIN